MRVFFIGFGQAGGKIVDMFIDQDKKLGTNCFRGIAVNTARTDLMGLKNVDMKDRILIGQTMLKGHGVGTDNVTGARVTADEIDSIISAIDIRGTHDIDAFVIVAGLGGGTGSGGSPVLARHLKRIYREPVYALGIIPSPEEGRLYSYNASRSLTTLVNECDNTFIFDNSAWKNEGESVKGAFQRLNNEVVRRFGVLFRAGEVSKMGVGEMVVDSSEIINTLRGGGITSVGYAISEVMSKQTKKKRGILRNLKDKFGGKQEANEEVLLGEDKSAKVISFADLSSPRRTSSFASCLPPNLSFRFLRMPRFFFVCLLITSLIAYPTEVIPPPRKVLIISLESTTISPTPISVSYTHLRAHETD